MIGLPPKGRMFLRGMRLLPPRAGITATIISRRELHDLSDHAVLLRFSQRGEKRDRDGAGIMGFRIRILTRSEAELAEIRMGVNRNVVHLSANSGGTQARECFGAGNAELLVPADDEKMPSRGTVRIAPRQHKPTVGQETLIAFGESGAPCDIFIQPRELAQPKRSLDICHAIVPAELLNFIIPGALGPCFHARGIMRGAMAAKPRHPRGNIGIIGEGRSAFSGGDDFNRMKAEDSNI